jgi:hypothetical protein
MSNAGVAVKTIAFSRSAVKTACSSNQNAEIIRGILSIVTGIGRVRHEYRVACDERLEIFQDYLLETRSDDVINLPGTNIVQQLLLLTLTAVRTGSRNSVGLSLYEKANKDNIVGRWASLIELCPVDEIWCDPELASNGSRCFDVVAVVL